MFTRRDFLKTTAGSLTAAFALPMAPASSHASLDRIGVGLFSIPSLLDADFAAAMKMLTGIGYKEVELFGPYPFSVPEAHERWTGLGETLGLKQSGYYGHTPQEVRAILDENGLSSPSMHVDWTTVRTRTEEMAEAAHVLGQRYAGIAAIPDDERQTLDDYKRIADAFNEVGARMDALGLRFMYHNHGYGLVEMEGEIPFNVLLERTDPDLVSLQMDVYWMTAGRADPVAYLDAYPGRFRSMHVKDMTEKVHFAGDGGDSGQWIELFPYMTDAGSGVLDLPAILSHARASGVEHFLVERDLAPEPETALRTSYDYLAAVDIEG